MGLKKVQEEVEDWVGQYEIGYWNPLENLAQLSEEVGELSRELNHQFGPKKEKGEDDKNEIGDELSDIIFTVGCIANSLDIDLDKAFEKGMDKRYERDADRWEKKD